MPKLPEEPPRSEITPEALYLRRREFIKNGALFAATAAGVGGGLLWLTRGGRPDPRRGQSPPPTPLPHDPNAPPPAGGELKIARRGRYTVDEKQNSYDDITTYNNFYEFGT